jgi:hypothetical protein
VYISNDDIQLLWVMQKMRNTIIFLFLITSIFSCKKEIKPFFDCPDERWPDFGIYSRNDSIIFCDTTRVNIVSGGHEKYEILATYKNRIEYLSKRKSGSGTERIYDLKTGKTIRNEFGPYNKSYKNGKLIIEPIRMFFYWDKQYEENNWTQQYYSVFKEEIYVENDSIKITEKEFILEPPLISEKALIRANEYFEETIELKNKKSDEYEKNLWSLQEILLTCSLNGDELSKQRLLKFKNTFPKYELERLNKGIKILKQFENKAHTHNIVYN